VSIVSEGGRASERTLVAASCTEATEAAVAILTAGASATGSGAAGSAAGLGTMSSDERARDEADAGKRALAPSANTLQIHPSLGARIGAEIGALAAVAPLLQIALGLELDRFALLAHAGTTSSVVGEIAGGTAGAEMSLWMGGLSACARMTTSNPSVSGCAGFEAGRLSAHGVGTSQPRAEHALWMAGLAQAVLDWNIASGSVASLGVTGVLPAQRLRVDAGEIEVHRTPPLGIRPWLGIGWRFQ
jgi:hypothetical protein